MLLGTLVLLRKSLRDLGAIVPKLRELGAVAGSAWRSEYEHAWREAFAVVAGAMLEGAAAATLEEAA